MSAVITGISWWTRIKDAFFGLILLVLGIIILFWNEKIGSKPNYLY